VKSEETLSSQVSGRLHWAVYCLDTLSDSRDQSGICLQALNVGVAKSAVQ